MWVSCRRTQACGQQPHALASLEAERKFRSSQQDGLLNCYPRGGLRYTVPTCGPVSGRQSQLQIGESSSWQRIVLTTISTMCPVFLTQVPYIAVPTVLCVGPGRRRIIMQIVKSRLSPRSEVFLYGAKAPLVGGRHLEITVDIRDHQSIRSATGGIQPAVSRP